jgi:hypothetical protein
MVSRIESIRSSSHRLNGARKASCSCGSREFFSRVGRKMLLKSRPAIIFIAPVWRRGDSRRAPQLAALARRQSRAMQFGRARREAAEDDARQRSLEARQGLGDRIDGDYCGSFCGKSVDAGRDRGKGDRIEAMLVGDFERAAIAGGEQPILVPSAAAPDRPDGVDDMARLQREPGRDLRFARRAAAKRPAGRKQLRPGRPVNRTIDAAAAGKAGIGGVDDRIDRQGRDIGNDDFETGWRRVRPWPAA